MLWALLRAELGASSLRSEAEPDDGEEEVSQHPENSPAGAAGAASTRVYNFLILPWHFEKLCLYGFAICLDCFLYLFTLLPLKGLQQLRVQLFETASRQPLRRRPTRSAGPQAAPPDPVLGSAPTPAEPPRPPQPPQPPQSPPSPALRRPSVARRRRELDLRQRRLWRFSRLVVLAAGTTALCFVDMSRVYHYIRGQSVLKLYVIFNMLQICDRMFASFGEDILEALYVGGRRGYGWLLHLAAACVYVFLHGLLLFCQVITLNVSVNSNNNSIFIVLVSNNFVELKQCVFKRFKEANLFQVTCADIVERFQLFLFLVVVMIQNLSHVGLAEAADWFSFAGGVFASVLGSEVLVDWVKHGFITKFNHMPPTVYQLFHELLCLDFCNSYQTAASRLLLRPPPDSPRSGPKRPGPPPMPHYSTISRRFGFSSFPLVCLFLRVAVLAFAGSSGSLHLKLALVGSCWLVCVLLKLLLSVWLLGHSAAFPGSLAALDAAGLSRSPAVSARREEKPQVKTEPTEPPAESSAAGQPWSPSPAGEREATLKRQEPFDEAPPEPGDDNVLRHRMVRFTSDASAQEIVRVAAYNLHARGGVSIDFSSKRESFFLKQPVDRYSMQGNSIY